MTSQPVEVEFQVHFSCLFTCSFGHVASMSVKSVALEVDLGSEDHELLLLALRLLAQEVVLVEVSPQVRVLRVEVLQPVRVAEVAEVVILAQMFEQVLVVYEALVAKLAERMPLEAGVVRVSVPPVFHEVLPVVELPLVGEHLQIGDAQVTEVHLMLPAEMLVQLPECFERRNIILKYFYEF